MSLLNIFHHQGTWRGHEITNRPDWIRKLDAHDLAEIHDALQHGKTQGVRQENITRKTFPLPTLKSKLAAIREELETATGATRLEGFDTAGYTLEDLQRIFLGLSAHIGFPISQSTAGEKIFHVSDAGFGMGHRQARGPNTSAKLHFHTDRCDVIGFFCVRQAPIGGENLLVNAIALHNELLVRRPDLLEVLYGPFYYKRHNVDEANPTAYHQQPIFAVHQGHFNAQVLRVLIDRAHAMDCLPDLTPLQKEALDALEDLARDPSLHYRFRQEPGDILLINNLVHFHAREEFSDHPDEARKRLLLRIWLAVPNSRPLAPAFKDFYGAVAPGVIRGGMWPPGASLQGKPIPDEYTT